MNEGKAGSLLRQWVAGVWGRCVLRLRLRLLLLRSDATAGSLVGDGRCRCTRRCWPWCCLSKKNACIENNKRENKKESEYKTLWMLWITVRIYRPGDWSATAWRPLFARKKTAFPDQRASGCSRGKVLQQKPPCNCYGCIQFVCKKLTCLQTQVPTAHLWVKRWKANIHFQRKSCAIWNVLFKLHQKKFALHASLWSWLLVANNIQALVT